MQKNDKAYAFLLSHSTKSGIYIRRVAVPKRFVHSGLLGLLLCCGITGITLLAQTLRHNPAFVGEASNASIFTKLSAEPPQQADSIETQPQEQQGTDEFASNSGGPEGDDQLVGENKQLEGELGEIQKNSDPANLPTMWAHLGKINNEFGFRRNPFGGRSYEFHSGMDIDGERGDPVVAPANGTVVKAGWAGGYGNMIEIDHGNGLKTRYGHLSKVEVSVGDVINRGQLIGTVGSTGRSTGPHLHYELRLGEKPINPRYLLPPEPTDLTAITKK